MFFHLALEGKIGRGRPRGSWIASQFRWSPIERWLPDGIGDMPVDDARAELVRRWLDAFGPGTDDDSDEIGRASCRERVWIPV